MYIQKILESVAADVLERTGVDVMDIRKERFTVIVRTIFWACAIDELKITQTALANAIGHRRARPTITFCMKRYKDWHANPQFYKTEIFWANILEPAIRKDFQDKINC